MLRNIIRLACVPEQVNLPIQIALERNIFQKYEIDVQIQWVPEGTGKMMDMIEKNETDIALTVTDALLVGISNGRKVQLSGVYVESPLIWAICTSPLNNKLKNVHELLNEKRGISKNVSLDVGISRLGSGSQTMAYYLAEEQRIDQNLNFKIANNFTGLRNGVQQKDFDLFLWETFTTKPFFDNRELYKLGDISAPWPAFSFATQHLDVHRKDEFKKYNLIKNHLYPAIFEGINIFLSNKEESVEKIISTHNHKREDAETWISNVRYSPNNLMSVESGRFDQSLTVLKRVGLIPSEYQTEKLWKDDPNVSLIN